MSADVSILPPLHGWSGFGWRSLVCRGLDPSGRAYSIAEVAPLPSGAWELVVAHDDVTALWRAEAPTREAAMRLAPGAVVALGGVWPSLDDEVHDYLFRRPGIQLQDVIDGTGLDRVTVKTALQRLRRHHRARTEGVRAGARWFAVGITSCVVLTPITREPLPPVTNRPEPPPRAAPTMPPEPVSPADKFVAPPRTDESLEAAIGRAVLDLVRTLLRHASAEASP